MASDATIDTERSNPQGLGLGMLTALAVGSMIGSGIFSLPQNMAAHSGAGAILIAWLITFFGMLALAFVFQNLANRKPELTGGVYGYARAGFGDLIGFSSAWGYWASAVIANVSFFVVFFSALGAFPALGFFGDGNTWQAVVAASLLLWVIHFLILRGVQAAALINMLTTGAKLVPIVLFIAFGVLTFDSALFLADFWGTPQLGPVLDQVKNSMLVTVWVFIGIEGASTFSSRARERRSVGRATLLGFLITTTLLVCVSILAMGIMRQPELAGLKNPSAAGVLAHAVGPWGAHLINIGLVISVGGALLAWTMIAAEVPYLAARDGVFPAAFARLNPAGTPAFSLWVSNGLVQLFLLLTLVSSAGYLSLLLLSTAMVLIPYLLCGLYAAKIALRRDGYPQGDRGRRRELLVGTLSAGYGIWLLYAAGAKYLLLSMILYAPGLLLFNQAKRARREHWFTGANIALTAAMVTLALVSLYGLATGQLTLG